MLSQLDLIAYRNPGYFADAGAWESYRRASRHGLAAADRVVVFSDHTRRELLADALVEQTSVRVVPPGLDHPSAAKPQAPAALGEGPSASLAGGFAFLGHLYPVWLKFRGGKGVATFFGILLTIAWPVGIATGLVWIAMAAIFRISSLAGLAAALSAPAMLMLMRRETPANLILLIATAVLIVLRHRENIVRIAKGAEPRIGAGKTPPAQ